MKLLKLSDQFCKTRISLNYDRHLDLALSSSYTLEENKK